MALSVVSFNIAGGDGTRNEKKEQINKFMNDKRPSLLLLQENLWRQDNIKKNIDVIRKEYESVSHKHMDAAVFYRKELDVLKEDTKALADLMDTFEKAFDATKPLKPLLDFEKFKNRSSFAKLTEKATGKSFIAISWHGEYSGLSNDQKEKKVKDFVSVIKEVNHSTKLPVVLGGDFNISLGQVQDVIKNAGFEVHSYKLKNRKTHIDFFIVTLDVDLREVKALGDYMYVDVENPESPSKKVRKQVFDHDPIMALFTYESGEEYTGTSSSEDSHSDESLSFKFSQGLSVK